MSGLQELGRAPVAFEQNERDYESCLREREWAYSAGR